MKEITLLIVLLLLTSHLSFSETLPSNEDQEIDDTTSKVLPPVDESTLVGAVELQEKDDDE